MVDFFKAFDFILREKMEQILRANGLPKETVTAIMMLYRNTKAKGCSPDGDTDFDIVAGVSEDTLEPYLFITFLDYGFPKSIDLIKESNFKSKKIKANNILLKLQQMQTM